MTYTDHDVKKWHTLYSDYTITSRQVSQTLGVKHETMLNRFRRLGLKLRPAGFRPGNSKGVTGKDLQRMRYLWLYKFAYKRRAAKKRLEFSLTEDTFVKLATSDCFYCGKSWKLETRYVRKVPINMLTVDRKDSKAGYTEANCVSACKQCNTIKMDYSIQEFLCKIRDIYAHCRLDKVLDAG